MELSGRAVQASSSSFPIAQTGFFLALMVVHLVGYGVQNHIITLFPQRGLILTGDEVMVQPVILRVYAFTA
ncbi:hypothetical protein BFX83_13475 [Komagataeibacter xylinus]|nr:hypothetical protein BFX83_13475 [Komagataeibacter xylinus]